MMPVKKSGMLFIALLILALCACSSRPTGIVDHLYVFPECEYNEAGQLILRTEFHGDGTPAYEIRYQYNEDGTCARYDHYSMAGELFRESVYEWDGDAYALHVTYYEAGVKTAFHKCGYETKDRVIRREVYDAADALQYTDLLEYHEGKDWLKKRTHRMPDGTYSVTNYDRWGQFIEETWYQADGRLLFEE